MRDLRAPWYRLEIVAERWFHLPIVRNIPPDVVLRLQDAADEWEGALRSVEPATPSVERRPPVRRAPAKSQRKSR